MWIIVVFLNDTDLNEYHVCLFNRFPTLLCGSPEGQWPDQICCNDSTQSCHCQGIISDVDNVESLLEEQLHGLWII